MIAGKRQCCGVMKRRCDEDEKTDDWADAACR